jgi:hypothetical protein
LYSRSDSEFGCLWNRLRHRDRKLIEVMYVSCTHFMGRLSSDTNSGCPSPESVVLETELGLVMVK